MASPCLTLGGRGLSGARLRVTSSLVSDPVDVLDAVNAPPRSHPMAKPLKVKRREGRNAGDVPEAQHRLGATLSATSRGRGSLPQAALRDIGPTLRDKCPLSAAEMMS